MNNVFKVIELESGGIRTVLKIVGNGKPIVYLHGASTLEGFDFAERLADNFQVICASHPGMGYSGDAPYLADMSDMLIHYLNLLDILALTEKPHLLGFSMGGWMATELAAIARERFDKVVLVAPAGLNDPAHPATPLSGIELQDFPGFLAHDVNVALRYFPDGSNTAQTAAFIAARARETETVSRLCATFGMGHPNLPRFLARITNPALIVWGMEDRLLPASQASLWVNALPNARLLSVPHAGHLVMQEKPEVVKQIGDFLTGRS